MLFRSAEYESKVIRTLSKSKARAVKYSDKQEGETRKDAEETARFTARRVKWYICLRGGDHRQTWPIG